MSDGIKSTSFFLYTRPSLRQPTAPVTCNVAFGTGLSDACCPQSMHTSKNEIKDLMEYPIDQTYWAMQTVQQRKLRGIHNELETHFEQVSVAVPSPNKRIAKRKKISHIIWNLVYINPYIFYSTRFPFSKNKSCMYESWTWLCPIASATMSLFQGIYNSTCKLTLDENGDRTPSWVI